MASEQTIPAPDPVRQWFRENARRAALARSPLSRRLSSLSFIAKVWRLRRLRYGPTGRRPVDIRLRSRLEGNPPGQWPRRPRRPAAPAAPPAAPPAPPAPPAT